MDNKKTGFVYIAKSECIRVLNGICPVKIGSACDLYNRIGNLDTAVPIDFKILMTAETEDYKGLEKEVHRELGEFRYSQGGDGNNTEFFTCDECKAKAVLRKLGMSSKYKAKFCTRFVQLGRSAQKMKTLKKDLEGGKIVFTCRNDKLGYNATAKYEIHGGELKFVISSQEDQVTQIRTSPTPSFLTHEPHSWHERWQTLMKDSDNTGMIKGPIICSTPAEAASIVCASIRNGNDEWVDNKWVGGKKRVLGEYLCRETRRKIDSECNDD